MIQKELIKMYLDFVNNFLTMDKFAEHYELSGNRAKQIINIGRELHEENVAYYKESGVQLYDMGE